MRDLLAASSSVMATTSSSISRTDERDTRWSPSSLRRALVCFVSWSTGADILRASQAATRRPTSPTTIETRITELR
jgi:hypothetical protein